MAVVGLQLMNARYIRRRIFVTRVRERGSGTSSSVSTACSSLSQHRTKFTANRGKLSCIAKDASPSSRCKLLTLCKAGGALVGHCSANSAVPPARSSLSVQTTGAQSHVFGATGAGEARCLGGWNAPRTRYSKLRESHAGGVQGPMGRSRRVPRKRPWKCAILRGRSVRFCLINSLYKKCIFYANCTPILCFGCFCVQNAQCLAAFCACRKFFFPTQDASFWGVFAY